METCSCESAVCWNVVNFCVNTGLAGWLGPCLNLSSQIAMNVRLHNTARNAFTAQPFTVCWKNLGIAITKGSRHCISLIMNINIREFERHHILGTNFASVLVSKQKLSFSWETSWVSTLCTLGCFTSCKSRCKSKAIKVGLGGRPPSGSAHMRRPEFASVFFKTSHYTSRTKQPRLRLQSGFSFSFTVFTCLLAQFTMCHTKHLVMFSANLALISASGAFLPKANPMGLVSTNYVPFHGSAFHVQFKQTMGILNTFRQSGQTN